jgi:hypothetical protein
MNQINIDIFISNIYIFQDIIDHLRSMILDISRIKRIDDKTISETLIKLLKILDNLLKYVSEFVKKALQVIKN